MTCVCVPAVMYPYQKEYMAGFALGATTNLNGLVPTGTLTAEYLQGFLAGVAIAKKQALAEVTVLRETLLSQQRQISNLIVMQERLKHDLTRATAFSRR